jgi:hypothetical protein
VENGWVTISGTVDRYYQRTCAESDARRGPRPTSDRRNPTRPGFTSPNGGQLFRGSLWSSIQFPPLYADNRRVGRAPWEIRLTEDRDLVGSARPAVQARRAKANSPKATTGRPRREHIFPSARRDSGRTQASEIATRAHAHIAVKRFFDGARPHNIAEPVKRPPTRREDIRSAIGWVGRGEASKSANTAIDSVNARPPGSAMV